MSIKKTIRSKASKAKRTVRKRQKNKACSSTSRLSQTIEIEEGSIFDDISVARATYLDVNPPGSKPFRVLLDDDIVDIGRDSSCAVALPLSNVSRKHAQVVPSGEEYVLEDLDSTNGTLVNNIRVSRCVLRHNDHIRIGDTTILFVHQKVRKLP